jgi:hypothetical protein
MDAWQRQKRQLLMTNYKLRIEFSVILRKGQSPEVAESMKINMDSRLQISGMTKKQVSFRGDAQRHRNGNDRE